MERGEIAQLRAPHASSVRLSEISHHYPGVVAVDRVSLEVGAGEFVTVLGPSGSGKTTLLRIIAGLAHPSAGRVFIGDRDVTAIPTQKRGVGVVFQNYALFPHLTVADNVAYPLRIRRFRRSEIRRRVTDALARVNLVGVDARYPSQLSGGQQQRVAVARALVYEPAVLLMDEPLGALDRKLRRHMELELRQLQRELRITSIYVTHDQEEALTMSDRVAVMHDGRILQVDNPMQLYRFPVDSFVAEFVGTTNLIECVLREQTAARAWAETSSGIRLLIPSIPGAAVGTRARIAIRPEAVRLGAGGEVDFQTRASISDVTFIGSASDVALVIDGKQRLIAQVPGRTAGTFEPGMAIAVGWKLADVSVFTEEVNGLGGESA